MAKSEAETDGNCIINKFCLCFGLLAISCWRLVMIIAVDNTILGGWRRNFIKYVIFTHFWQACVVVYLTLKMRSDYAKCVMVGKSAYDRISNAITKWPPAKSQSKQVKYSRLSMLRLSLIKCCLICLYNKANLRDLIAATGLVILLKLDSNRRFFSLCDLEIWWMTPKNNRTPLLCYFKLSASFRSHWWLSMATKNKKGGERALNNSIKTKETKKRRNQTSVKTTLQVFQEYRRPESRLCHCSEFTGTLAKHPSSPRTLNRK